MVRSAARRDVTQVVGQEFELSQRRACRVIGIHRSTVRHKPMKKRNDEELMAQMKEILLKNPRYGAPRVHRMLRRQGVLVNHKRTEKLYYSNGLELKKRPPKRIRRRPVSELPRPSRPNQKWSLDFVHDNLSDGRSLRMLTVIDEFTRESIAVEVDTSIGAERLIATLKRIGEHRTLPNEIGVDQGPEFTSLHFLAWAKSQGIGVSYCRPGNKNENAFIESFNGRLRDECLNMNWFLSLKEARTLIENWRLHYNQERPHSSLGGKTPFEFAAGFKYDLVA